MLLNLVKHSHPDLSNCTRELSKVMDCATTIQWNELIDTKESGLRMDPTNYEKWHLEAFSHADFAGDKYTRISDAGYIIYFKCIPVCWRLKGQ